MSDKCKHGVRDTATNLPYCRRCDDERKEEAVENLRPRVDGLLNERRELSSEVKRFFCDVEPLLMQWCIEHPHWRRSESDPWQDPYGGHDLLRRVRALSGNDPDRRPGESLETL